MKQYFKRFFTLCLSIVLAISCTAAPSYANSTNNLMAYNLYSDPVTTGTSASWDTFTIEFRSSETGANTYWALANWSMDLTGSRSIYRGISGGGAYAGLQNTTGGRKAILSFWEMSYRNEILRAKRIYPAGADNNFGGEGEGTNWITSYEWEDDSWYRMVLHCWTDAENGTTFVGQWFQNVQTGEWELISYFDTHLYDSFFKGGMSQFMENYTAGTSEVVREYNYKNLYGLDHESGEWVSLNSSKLSYDSGATNKTGEHEFGATEEYFWGRTYGIELDDQTAYNKKSITSKVYSITQPATPTFGTPVISKLNLVQSGDAWKISWDMSDTGTPQLSYTVELIDLDGNVVSTAAATRPETNNISMDLTDDTALKCRLTVTDVFGETVTLEQESEAYQNASNTEQEDQTSGGDTVTDTAENETNLTAKTNLTAIIIAVMAAVVVVAAAVVVIVIVSSKKKKQGKN